MDKPTVLVQLSAGGIPSAEVISGEADIVLIDWDVVNHTTSREEIEGYLVQAARLPHDYAGKDEIIGTLLGVLEEGERWG